MNLNSLSEIANAMVEKGRGILAADESTPTCKKRFDSINVESNEANRISASNIANSLQERATPQKGRIDSFVFVYQNECFL